MKFFDFSLSAASDGYRLSYDAFLGGVVGDSLKKSQGVQFSTYDKDQDDSQLYSCARLHRVSRFRAESNDTRIGKDNYKILESVGWASLLFHNKSFL